MYTTRLYAAKTFQREGHAFVINDNLLFHDRFSKTIKKGEPR